MDAFNKANKIDEQENYSTTAYKKSYLTRLFSFDTTSTLLEIFMEG
jgi:hypothetical protein